MRAVVQRADSATVEVDGATLGGFDGPGLVVLVGVTHDDSTDAAKRLANKVWGLRIFDKELLPVDVRGRMNLETREVSAADGDLPILVISQFTLYGDTRKGRRPTWDAAAPGAVAEPLIDVVVAELRALGARVYTGRFGAHMRVNLINDGPFTLVLDV